MTAPMIGIEPEANEVQNAEDNIQQQRSQSDDASLTAHQSLTSLWAAETDASTDAAEQTTRGSSSSSSWCPQERTNANLLDGISLDVHHDAICGVGAELHGDLSGDRTTTLNTVKY
jgi:hypothetical protein